MVGAAALNHTLSRELVAFSYLVGDYLTRNVSKALEMFEELNELGNPRGQLVSLLVFIKKIFKLRNQNKMVNYCVICRVLASVIYRLLHNLLFARFI